jgi:hypothetical protein
MVCSTLFIKSFVKSSTHSFNTMQSPLAVEKITFVFENNEEEWEMADLKCEYMIYSTMSFIRQKILRDLRQPICSDELSNDVNTMDLKFSITRTDNCTETNKQISVGGVLKSETIDRQYTNIDRNNSLINNVPIDKLIEPVIELIEPVEPIESVNQPIESVDQPVEPIESVNRPVEPIESVNQPVEPIEPIESVDQPVEPTFSKMHCAINIYAEHYTVVKQISQDNEIYYESSSQRDYADVDDCAIVDQLIDGCDKRAKHGAVDDSETLNQITALLGSEKFLQYHANACASTCLVERT